MTNSELSNIYDKLIKHYSNIERYVDKNDILEKVISNKHHYNPLKKSSPRMYFATLIKSTMIREYDKNKTRIELVEKRNRKIDIILNESN